jgi:predicted Zn-dependent protease
MLAGAAAMAAAASAGNGEGAAPLGAKASPLAGGQAAAQRSLTAYQRGEELAADRAAITYLNATGQSARGMLEVFSRFADQTMFTGRFVDPYVRSHPMARDRINQIDRLARQSQYFERRDPPERQLRHDLAMARLTALLDGERTVMRRYPNSDTSLPARYARALAEGRTGSARRAIQQLDQLIAIQPSNPFFWEARGTILFENGNPRDAARSWARALELAPNNTMIRVFYGAALGRKRRCKRALPTAIGELERGLANDQTLWRSAIVFSVRPMRAAATQRWRSWRPGWKRSHAAISKGPKALQPERSKTCRAVRPDGCAPPISWPTTNKPVRPALRCLVIQPGRSQKETACHVPF